MRINEALGDPKDLKIEFDGGGVLNVQYRPPNWTPREIEAMKADEKNIRRVVAQMQGLLVAWDLTGNSGEPIDIADAEAMMDVPISIYNKITTAIREDNSPGEA
jgi:hypothetical protein